MVRPRVQRVERCPSHGWTRSRRLSDRLWRVMAYRCSGIVTIAPSSQVAPAWTAPHQSLSLTVFKTAGVVASSWLFVGLLVHLGAALLASSVPVQSFAVAFAGLLIGYLFADFLSGSVHWFCDTFFSERTPIIGRVLIQPFRDHHVHPQRIVHFRFIEQDTTNFFLMLPFLLWAFLASAPAPDRTVTPFWCSVLVGLCSGSFGTNLFHKWAHARRPPAVVRALQKAGLILGPERHERHHRDYGRGFCVTSGWMNPALDAVRFFPRFERLIRSLSR